MNGERGRGKRTERDGVDFAFDLNDAVLDVEDVDDLVNLRLCDQDLAIVLVVFLRPFVSTNTDEGGGQGSRCSTCCLPVPSWLASW